MDSGLITANLALAGFFLMLLVGGGAIIGVLIYLIVHTRKKSAARALRIQQFAHHRGWYFTPRASDLGGRFRFVAPFGLGTSRTFRNIIRLRIGEHTGFSFDYSYVESSGGSNGNQQTHRFHVVAVDLPGALPPIEIRREGPMRGFVEFFGVTDVQFESEEFNRAWYVQAQNRRFAHDLIHPQMIAWLMRPEQGFANFAIETTTCFTVLPGEQDVTKIEPLVDYLAEFLSRTPQFVWDRAAPLGPGPP